MPSPLRLRGLGLAGSLVLLACGGGPLGEPGLGEVQHFERGDPLLIVESAHPFTRLYTYQCTNCSIEAFEALRPPHDLRKSRIWTLWCWPWAPRGWLL